MCEKFNRIGLAVFYKSKFIDILKIIGEHKFVLFCYYHSCKIVLFHELYGICSFHIEYGLSESISLISFVRNHRDVHDITFILGVFGIDDMMIILSSDIPIPYVASRGCNCFVADLNISKQASVEGILYSYYPFLSIFIKSACVDIATGIYVEIVISEYLEDLRSFSSRISFTDSSEVQEIVFSHLDLVSVYDNFIQIERRFPFKFLEISRTEIMRISNGRKINERIEKPIGFCVHIFRDVKQIDKPS